MALSPGCAGPATSSGWRARTVDHPNGAVALLAATTLDGFLGTTTLSHIQQLYLATDQGINMASLTMPATDPAANPAITWTPFAAQDKTTQLETVGNALQVGPGASALLLATGDHALTAATPDAISILSGEPASVATTTSAPPNLVRRGRSLAGQVILQTIWSPRSSTPAGALPPRARRRKRRRVVCASPRNPMEHLPRSHRRRCSMAPACA